jgi:hypothetical protein
MDNTRAWVLVIGILLIFGVTAFGTIWVVNNAINRTVSPIQSMTGALSTQVAEFINPTPTILPDPVTIVREVRSLARLETIQYTVEKIITAETKQEPFGFLFGDRLILVAHGYLIAGVDLQKLGPDDVWLEKDVMFVRLPEPDIFVATLDNEKSYVYDRDKGILTKGDITLESAARKAAENEIEKSAIEDGILDLARQNAEVFLYRFFRELGLPEVIFVNSLSTPGG